MSLKIHKNIPDKIPMVPIEDNSRAAKENNSLGKQTRESSEINKDALPSRIPVLDIERENRVSKILSLHSKGLNQEEIALELCVDQSTVSRDLQLIKQEARKQVERYLREDILLEYLRYMAGSNEITRQLGSIEY
jgi:hypothetical protein